MFHDLLVVKLELDCEFFCPSFPSVSTNCTELFSVVICSIQISSQSNFFKVWLLSIATICLAQMSVFLFLFCWFPSRPSWDWISIFFALHFFQSPRTTESSTLSSCNLVHPNRLSFPLSYRLSVELGMICHVQIVTFLFLSRSVGFLAILDRTGFQYFFALHFLQSSRTVESLTLLSLSSGLSKSPMMPTN